MSNAPVQLIVAAFQNENGADEALKQLKAAKKEKLIGIDNAAVIRKDAHGKVHIKETGDTRGGKGALMGGVVGAALGVLTGGATLAIAGVGAVVGGLAAKLRDSGFRDDRLRQVGDSLKPGSSAIVAVIEHTWVLQAEAELREAGAQVLTEAISADIAAQLEAGRESAYTLVASDEGMAAGRVVTGEDVAMVSGVVATDEGVEAARVAATSDAVVAEHMVVTDEAAMYEGIVAIAEEGEGEGDSDAPASEDAKPEGA